MLVTMRLGKDSGRATLALSSLRFTLHVVHLDRYGVYCILVCHWPSEAFVRYPGQT